jgi:L-glyceraldehyde 3-phosphate reductase
VAAPVLRRLGQSGIDVSVVSLGSWRTYEPLPRERGVAVLREARERGITFLDDARYDDETGTAPLRTGWSEVLFGELFRAAGWNRDEVVVANKLWWEFWPDETAAAELDGSLGRLGFDHVDLIYSARPPDGLPVADLVAAVNGLIESGKARAWGLLNWPTDQIDEAARV